MPCSRPSSLGAPSSACLVLLAALGLGGCAASKDAIGTGTPATTTATDPIVPEAWLDRMMNARSVTVRSSVFEALPSGEQVNEYGEAEYTGDDIRLRVWTNEQFANGTWTLGPNLTVNSTTPPGHVLALRGDIVEEAILLPTGEYHRYEPYDKLAPLTELSGGSIPPEMSSEIRKLRCIPMGRARQAEGCSSGLLTTSWIGRSSATTGETDQPISLRRILQDASMTRTELDGQAVNEYRSGRQVLFFSKDGLVRWDTILAIENPETKIEERLVSERRFVWTLDPDRNSSGKD